MADSYQCLALINVDPLGVFVQLLGTNSVCCQFFGGGFALLFLFALELKNDGLMSIEQSFAGVDKTSTYYATFIIFFSNTYENLSF